MGEVMGKEWRLRARTLRLLTFWDCLTTNSERLLAGAAGDVVIADATGGSAVTSSVIGGASRLV